MRSREEIRARLDEAEKAGGPIAAMGLRFTEFDLVEGWIRAEMVPGDQHRNMGGGVHGGVLAALADIVAGVGVVCSIGADDWTTTTELSISFLRRLKKPPVVITARALHRGLRVHTWQVDIEEGAGRLMARARLSFLVSQGGRV